MSHQSPANPIEDPELLEYRDFLLQRSRRYVDETKRIREKYGSLAAYAGLYKSFGIHKIVNDAGKSLWLLREYMPNAQFLWLTGSKLNFQRFASHRFEKKANGIFELILPEQALAHGDYIELRLVPLAQNGHADLSKPLRRIPAFASWVVQDSVIPAQWCARIWDPPQKFKFSQKRPMRKDFPLIYEAHVGMAQPSSEHTAETVGSYAEFARNILPRIKADGYNCVQLMGILEHPLYRSFGYQVSNYFAPSSRFGTPDELKLLIDEAHRLELAVILDVTHAHASSNTEQGLAQYDGSNYFFNEKTNQWGTPSFDYENEGTRRFLLSNCRYWLEEYNFDGLRFDAVGNMLYADHGIDDNFSHASRCFYDKNGNRRTNEAGELYLCLANELIHETHDNAISIAEEFSGMPGLTCSQDVGGLGFDYRFAMGIPDYWAKFIDQPKDMGSLWYEMTNHRPYDHTISYVECHDQCINGDDAMIWRLLGDDMYKFMSFGSSKWNVDRGLAFYRLMRLITLATADAGYLNFMGNEFGHPEWLDAEEHAHRQWHLAEQRDLKYYGLSNWDKAQLLILVGDHLDDFMKQPLFRYIHEDDRLICFERGNLLFAFNFHELRAKNDLLFAVTPGKYIEILSSDEKKFAGHGNLSVGDNPLEHFTQPIHGRSEQDINLYLPPMVALVLCRTD